ncbi:hypothetical protein WA158_004988 [Blastocystis sp. Blastoise]
MEFLLFVFFAFSAMAGFCGRFSDDCSTIPGQDIDYVFYSNTAGQMYKIEMQNVQPADDKCGENHLYGLIWTYDVIQTLGPHKYTTYSTDVAFVSYDLAATTQVDCGIPIQKGVPISLWHYNCTINGINQWAGFTTYLHQKNDLDFETDEQGRFHFARGTYNLVNADGCPLGVNYTAQIVIIVVVCFCVVLGVLFVIYVKYNKKSIKTLAGEKTKLFKQDKKMLKIKTVKTLKAVENKKELKKESPKSPEKVEVKPQTVHV